MHAGERARRDHLLQHVDGIVLDQAQVREAAFADLLEQRADAGRVHFDADEVGAGQRLRDRRGRVAHAEADLEHLRRVAAERGGEVERCGGIRQREARPEFVRLLAGRLAPGGYLHCATDWQPYAEQMLAVLSAESMLQNTAEAYAPRPGRRPLTKFENRGLRLGHGVWDLVFVRRAV